MFKTSKRIHLREYVQKKKITKITKLTLSFTTGETFGSTV